MTEKLLTGTLSLNTTKNRWGDSNEYPQNMFSLETSRWSNSNEYSQHTFLWRNKQNDPFIITKYLPYLFHWISTCISMANWKTKTYSYLVCVPTPDSSVGRLSARGTGGHGFDPGSRHTKVVKNGTSCSSLGTQSYRVELGLVNPVSV